MPLAQHSADATGYLLIYLFIFASPIKAIDNKPFRRVINARALAELGTSLTARAAKVDASALGGAGGMLFMHAGTVWMTNTSLSQPQNFQKGLFFHKVAPIILLVIIFTFRTK